MMNIGRLNTLKCHYLLILSNARIICSTEIVSDCNYKLSILNSVIDDISLYIFYEIQLDAMDKDVNKIELIESISNVSNNNEHIIDLAVNISKLNYLKHISDSIFNLEDIPIYISYSHSTNREYKFIMPLLQFKYGIIICGYSNKCDILLFCSDTIMNLFNYTNFEPFHHTILVVNVLNKYYLKLDDNYNLELLKYTGPSQILNDNEKRKQPNNNYSDLI